MRLKFVDLGGTNRWLCYAYPETREEQNKFITWAAESLGETVSVHNDHRSLMPWTLEVRGKDMMDRTTIALYWSSDGL